MPTQAGTAGGNKAARPVLQRGIDVPYGIGHLYMPFNINHNKTKCSRCPKDIIVTVIKFDMGTDIT
ncbi:hypothetical protein AA12717_0804 [Gluconacetobacter sacchari DSM 12717]|uniref:Uncharacterized protein n=1 Tax=Gluconacetobacter sacchari DSM 12717 TaxID=1307940 RepID=A0ABQ0P3S7_9PROT|nr:hypothetical protein AA12717_0804 [Gluconacetobacter sacchari DSM 12717]